MTTAESAPNTQAERSQTCDAGLVRAFELLGKRWNGMILGSLSSGPTGFADLRRVVGTIADSVLSDRLTELMAAGLVVRLVTDTRPPGVSYSLSPQGCSLLPILDELAEWATANLGGHAGSATGCGF